MELKYSIGQEIFWGRFEMSDNSVECPHCGGSAQVLVTFHDGTTVSIECGNCAGSILERSNGRVTVFDRSPYVQRFVVTGYEVQPDSETRYRGHLNYEVQPDSETRYRGHLNYTVEESRLFESDPEAMEYAKGLAAEEDRRERERVQQKAKPTRNWAWNASYHRSEIKRAKRSIEHHEASLAVASVKAKT